MLLLIDGYNLLHQSDLLPRGRGQHWLRRARQRLLRRLATALDAPLRSETCIVFDASDPPPGRPARLLHQGIDVRFAVDAPEADDVLERLIARHPTPRRLFVVSSDHRIQRAARRRRCGFDDVDRWYEQLLDGQLRLAISWPPPNDSDTPAKPTAAVDPELVGDTAGWMEAFGFPVPGQTDAPEQTPKSEQGRAPEQGRASEQGASSVPLTNSIQPPRNKPAQRNSKRSKAAPRRKKPSGSKRTPKIQRPKRPKRPPSHDPNRPLDGSANNPFPEGYGEDLLEP